MRRTIRAAASAVVLAGLLTWLSGGSNAVKPDAASDICTYYPWALECWLF